MIDPWFPAFPLRAMQGIEYALWLHEDTPKATILPVFPMFRDPIQA
jgi:hypothetical protein